ncbi:hypothetical protein Droror1_Dr00026311 [Drosera rotundifolia]
MSVLFLLFLASFPLNGHLYISSENLITSTLYIILFPPLPLFTSIWAFPDRNTTTLFTLLPTPRLSISKGGESNRSDSKTLKQRKRDGKVELRTVLAELLHYSGE